MWEFIGGDQIPDVQRGCMKCFIILVRRVEGHEGFTMAAWYLNAYPLDMEDCRCDQEHDDGCPTTGWFYDSSNFEYDNCYHHVEGTVVSYAPIPTAEQAAASLKGPW